MLYFMVYLQWCSSQCLYRESHLPYILHTGTVLLREEGSETNGEQERRERRVGGNGEKADVKCCIDTGQEKREAGGDGRS